MSKDSFSLHSMTAFGEGEAVCSEGRFIVELQSVNRRFLEIHPHLPRFISSYEHQLRERLAASLARGQVHLSVHFHKEGMQEVSVKPNLPLALQLKRGWEEIAATLGLSEKVPLELLVREKELFTIEDRLEKTETLHKALMEALECALSQLIEQRAREGASLAKDLYERTNRLSTFLSQIEALSGDQVAVQREKLSKRLTELFENQEENEERLMREVALLAERLDITEEVVRLKIHLKQFEEIVTRQVVNAGQGVGKELEFLVQELGREINTIGSKSQNAQITAFVVSMKSELEKIREQVHNVE